MCRKRWVTREPIFWLIKMHHVCLRGDGHVPCPNSSQETYLWEPLLLMITSGTSVFICLELHHILHTAVSLWGKGRACSQTCTTYKLIATLTQSGMGMDTTVAEPTPSLCGPSLSFPHPFILSSPQPHWCLMLPSLPAYLCWQVLLTAPEHVRKLWPYCWHSGSAWVSILPEVLAQPLQDR